jgi:purine-binding chemotaxis protein CheW
VSGIHVRVRLGREHYALPVDLALEVAELGDLTPVPGSPPAVLGLRNLRGQVIPVLSLATVLGLSPGDPLRIVLAELGDRRAGLAVDSIVDVGALPAPSEQVDSPFIAAATLVDGTLVGFLDAEAILSTASSAGAAP